jgi:hypothetical protein
MSDWQEQRRRRDQLRRDELMRLPALPVRRHAVITGRDGDVLVCASVGPGGELAAVWAAGADLDAVTSRTVSPGGASFPDPGAARPVTARITAHAPGLVAVTPIADLALAHITVQPMPGGRFLVAGARCQWRPGGPDRNAVLYDTDEHALSEHVLGDGLRHVLADSTGQVWAGYVDEGIYGNYGWGPTDTPEPVGAYGIVRFSPPWNRPGTSPATTKSARGRRSATVPPSTSTTLPRTWACYDPDYPVVRIREGTVTGWHNDITCVRALAVTGSRAALFGGYSPDHHRLAITGLTVDHARPADEYRIVLPDGQPFPPGT